MRYDQDPSINLGWLGSNKTFKSCYQLSGCRPGMQRSSRYTDSRSENRQPDWDICHYDQHRLRTCRYCIVYVKRLTKGHACEGSRLYVNEQSPNLSRLVAIGVVNPGQYTQTARRRSNKSHSSRKALRMPVARRRAAGRTAAGYMDPDRSPVRQCGSHDRYWQTVGQLDLQTF